jgi:hypothetical protein
MWLPSVMVGAWFLSMFWAFSTIARFFNWRHATLFSAAIGSVIIYACLNANVAVGQILYWQTGVATYPPGLIVGTLAIGLLFARIRPEWRIIGVFSLTLVGAGFSETYAIAQLTGFGFALVTLYGFGLSAAPRSKAVWAGLLGSLTGLAVVASAPGNFARLATISQPRPGPGLLVSLTVHYTTILIARLLVRRPLTTTLLFCLGAVVGGFAPKHHQTAIKLAVTGVVGTLIVIFSCPVCAFGTGVYLDWRIQLIPHFFCELLFLQLGFLAFLVVARRLADTRVLSLALLICVGVASLMGPPRQVSVIASMRGAAQNYAALFDRQDAELRSAARRGDRHATVALLPREALGMQLETREGADPTFSVNCCIARYYGLSTLVAKQTGSNSDAAMKVNVPSTPTPAISMK